MSKETKLQVKDLKVSFHTPGGKVQAVRNISFDLNEGETLAIVGESGSGKSVTARSMLGILAGNSIIESGEIFYDGQDLLRISEEEFQKIRGDKISMIFQDPLSSLNPIIKIGKQMTEAMVIKSKARSKQCREDFNAKLKHIIKLGTQMHPENKEKYKTICKEFDSFEYTHIVEKIARENSVSAAKNAITEIDDLLFKIEKNAVRGIRKECAQVERYAARANGGLIKGDDAFAFLALLREIKTLANGEHKKEKASRDYSAIAALQNKVREILKTELEKPYDISFTFDKKEEFLSIIFDVIEKSHKDTIQKKQEILNYLEEAAEFFGKKHEKLKNTETKFFDKLKRSLEIMHADNKQKSSLKKKRNELLNRFKSCFEPLAIETSIVQSTFAVSFSLAIKMVLKAEAFNKKDTKRYNSQLKKKQRCEAKGKTLGYSIVPLSLIDTETEMQNIKHIILRLKEQFAKDIEESKNIDYQEKADAFIAYLESCAEGYASKVTKYDAKLKALELMDEVGISDPLKRYNQYPFEFSGGMRQRIVIAIALAANPDILVCDEPTTALDVTIQAQILELINKLKRERNISVMFITHDLGVVANMADRIAVMYAGKIVEYGTVEEVFYSPAHPYTWALLSSVPDLDTTESLDAIQGTPPNMIYPPKGDAFAARNKYALEIDFEEEPPLFKISDTHYAATWLLHPDAPKVEPPLIVTERIKRMKKLLLESQNVVAENEQQSEPLSQTPQADSKPKKVASKAKKASSDKTVIKGGTE